MDSNPYIADGTRADETLRAIGAALVGLKPERPVLFAGDPSPATFAASWNSWITARFLPVIAPHFISVRDAFPSLRPKEVAAMDAAFSALLDPQESSRSIPAAIALKNALAGARHRPELDKIFAALDAAASPLPCGHFPTLLAARCASHHIPLASSLAAYLHFECTSGLLGHPAAKPVPQDTVLTLILPAVRSALDARPHRSYRVA